MNYKHLTIDERCCLHKYHREGLSCREVLRRKGKRHGKAERRGKYNHAKSIRKRDKCVYRRTEAGHWEADTVVSGWGKSKACFATLVERKTRYTSL